MFALQAQAVSVFTYTSDQQKKAPKTIILIIIKKKKKEKRLWLVDYNLHGSERAHLWSRQQGISEKVENSSD